MKRMALILAVVACCSTVARADDPACIYVLANSGTALSTTGRAELLLPTCGIKVNSSSSEAVQLLGNSTISAYFLDIDGGYSVGMNSTLTIDGGGVNTGAGIVDDPLILFDIPNYGTCDYNDTAISGMWGDTVLNPGVYCNGITITGNGTTTLNPGVYIVDGGSFSVSSNANLTGNGVTIFLNKKLQSSYATLSLTGSGTRTIVAPASGTYAGIAIFQSRNADNGPNTIEGSGSLNVNGTIYLPNQHLRLGGSISSSECASLIVGSLSLSGKAHLGCTSGEASRSIQ